MKLPIDQLKVGMEVDGDVINLNQALLIPQDTILTERHLRLLKMWGVNSVAVREEGPAAETAATEIPPNPELVAAAQACVDKRFRHVKPGSTIGDIVRKIALERAVAALGHGAATAIAAKI